MSQTRRFSNRLANPGTANPAKKFSPANEEKIKQAEVFGTRATITELGVAQFLSTHMPCGDEIVTAADMLLESADLRAQGRSIMDKVGVDPTPARRKKKVR